MAKKKNKGRRKSKGILGALTNPIMGSAGVLLYETVISPRIPLTGQTKNIAELFGGIMLMKRPGIVGATGKALVTLNTFQLMKELVGGSLLTGNSGDGNIF